LGKEALERFTDILEKGKALPRKKAVEPPTRWISLKQASALLGVNPSTLRRWADRGQVRSFRTLGGHRRFSEESLQALIAEGRPQPAPDYQALAKAVAGRIRRQLRNQEAPWLRSLKEEDREQLRLLGRRLLEVMARFLSRPTRRGRLREEAREIGREYGQRLAAAGISFHDALAAFFFFRRTILHTALEVARKGSFAVGDLAEISAQVGDLADEVLLAISQAFQPLPQGMQQDTP